MERRAFFREAARAMLSFGVLGPDEEQDPRRGGGFAGLRERYFHKVLERYPTLATHLGAAGFDPRLAALDARLRAAAPAAVDEEIALWRSLQRELRGLAPEALAATDRVDREVVDAQLAFLLHQLEDLRHHERGVDAYVAAPVRGVERQISNMQPAGEGRGDAEAWRRVADRVAAVAGHLRAARQNLLAGRAAGHPPDHRLVRIDGIRGSRAAASHLREALPASARRGIRDRAFAADILVDLDAAAAQAADAYDSFADFLGRTFDADGDADRFAIGEAEYEWRLRNNFRETRGVEALLEHAAGGIAQARERVIEAASVVARQRGLSLDWSGARRAAAVRVVLDDVARDAPSSDAELFAAYRDAVARAAAWARDAGWIDADERPPEVEPTPPLLRTATIAAYDPAPPLLGRGGDRLWLTPTGDDRAALRLLPRAALAPLAAHEALPGHAWHYRAMGRHAAEIPYVRWLSPGGADDSGSMWHNAPAVEGWALWAEERVARPIEGGLYAPAEYLHETIAQLLRTLRLRLDIALHTGRITFAAAVDELCDIVAFMPDARGRAASDGAAAAVLRDAEREVYRYTKWPTQAIAYALGKESLERLHGAVAAARDGGIDDADFARRVARQGPIPAAYYGDRLVEEARWE